MKKLRIALLALIGVIFLSFMAGCSPKVQGKYVGDNTSWYSTLNIQNGKGTEENTSDIKADETSTKQVTVKGDKISIDGDEQSYTLDKEGNIELKSGFIFYKADSDKGKELIAKEKETKSSLKTESDFGIGAE